MAIIVVDDRTDHRRMLALPVNTGNTALNSIPL